MIKYVFILIFLFGLIEPRQWNFPLTKTFMSYLKYKRSSNNLRLGRWWWWWPIPRYYSIAEKEGVQNILLSDYSHIEYYADVCVGTPCQWFQMVPDTGSSNTWVYSYYCTSLPCWFVPTYDSYQSSSTFENHAEFSLIYGSGKVDGFLTQDTFSLGDLEVANFTFGEALTVTGSQFLQSEMSGILGLGFPALSKGGLTTFMESIEEEDKSFAFYLSQNQSHSFLTMPGYDQNLMEGEFQFHNVTGTTYWALNLTSVTLNGSEQYSRENICPKVEVQEEELFENEENLFLKRAPKKFKRKLKQLIPPQGGRFSGEKRSEEDGEDLDYYCYSELEAVLDSGSSFIIGPNELIESLTEHITVNQDCSGVEQLPDIAITLDDSIYTLTWEDYVFRFDEGDEAQCALGLVAAAFLDELNYLILGNVFIRKYYTYFDMNLNRVGFAQKKLF